MIAIVGNPILSLHPAEPRAVGLAASIAAAAAAAGGIVQIVGKVGDDPDGDAVLLALGRAGIGHVATLRAAGGRTPVFRSDPLVGAPAPDVEPNGPGASLLDDEASDETDGSWNANAVLEPSVGDRPALDGADVELALRYLPDVAVVVVVEPAPGITEVCAIEAAAAGAHLVVVLATGSDRAEDDDLPPDALVLAAPDAPDPLAFASLVGRYVVLVAAGTSPERAFETVLGDRAAERATP